MSAIKDINIIQKNIRLDSYKDFVELPENLIPNSVRVFGLDDFNNVIDGYVDFILLNDPNRIYLRLPENYSDDEQFEILYATSMENKKEKNSDRGLVNSNPCLNDMCNISFTSSNNKYISPSETVSFTGFSHISDIKDIEIIVPGKVLQIEFGDGNKEKMVLKEPDEFNIEKCLYIALAKKLYKKDLTSEGIEYISSKLKYNKKYKKIVDKGIKLYYSKINQMGKDAQEAEELSKQIERKRKKKEEYKNRRKEKRIQEESDKEMAILNNVLKDIAVELKEISEKAKDKNVDSLKDIFGNFKKENSDTDNKNNNDSNDYLKELEELLNKLKEEFCN